MELREKMEILDNIFADIGFICRIVKKFNHADYELYKKRIDRLNLDPAEYNRAIKKLAEAIKI